MVSHQKEAMTIGPFVSCLIISEWDDRRNRSIARAIRQAKFRHKASVEEVSYSVEWGMDKNQIQRLASLSFIHGHQDVFTTGSIGTGKASLATALGHEACQKRVQGFLYQYSPADGIVKAAEAKNNID